MKTRLVLNTRPAVTQWAADPPSNNQLVVVEKVGPLVSIPPTPIVITAVSGTGLLSHYLRLGRTYHTLCRNTFVQRVQYGYYAYERREEWQTCALAAAYAGAFGPQSIEQPEFSYTMAIWRLSQLVGFDIGTHQVSGPTGRRGSVAEEMIRLVDDNYWTRAGVAEWLASIGV